VAEIALEGIFFPGASLDPGGLERAGLDTFCAIDAFVFVDIPGAGFLIDAQCFIRQGTCVIAGGIGALLAGDKGVLGRKRFGADICPGEGRSGDSFVVQGAHDLANAAAGAGFGIMDDDSGTNGFQKPTSDRSGSKQNIRDFCFYFTQLSDCCQSVLWIYAHRLRHYSCMAWEIRA
jgi:hypothetical protein